MAVVRGQDDPDADSGVQCQTRHHDWLDRRRREGLGHHWTETRVRAHVFICMLAAYLVWHLRQAWAPLTFTDEHRPEAADPVAPAQRSQGADHKAATKTTTDDLPATSFTALLGHLSTLTRNHLRVAGHDQSGFDLLAIPTPTGRRAFELTDPTHPEVARTPHRQNDETPAQQGFHALHDT